MSFEEDEFLTTSFDEQEEETQEKARPSKRSTLHDTAPVRERAILVGVSQPPSVQRWTVDDHLDELASLAETAGVEVVDRIFQNRSRIEAATFIGKGKVEELARLVEDDAIQVIIFDDDLSSMQVRNLERDVKCKIMDRTGLILDIFAKRAVTKEAQTQVELAQLEYLLPRLTRQWTHLSKQYGGIGTKGPGETQIETDRRLVRTRISVLKEKLVRIEQQRATQRQSRTDVPRVALVGYTNVGKSTLLNHLSNAGVLVENKLFATLDSTVREIEIAKNVRVLLSDTVGFIRKLPTHLVASFKSTLAEVVEADLLLHVVDVTHPLFDDQIQVVDATLSDIGASGKPTIMVFNKIDALEEKGVMLRLRDSYPHHVFIAARSGMNVSELLELIVKLIHERNATRTFRIRPADFRIEAEFHRATKVIEQRYDDGEIFVTCTADTETIDRLLKSYADVLTVMNEA